MESKPKAQICKNCWYAKLMFNLYACDVDKTTRAAEETCSHWRDKDPWGHNEPKRCTYCGAYACECYT